MGASMVVEYKKDLHHSYMVIAMDNDITISEYCIKLLERQRVDGVLPLERRVIDNHRMFYYEITSKQVMQSLLLKATLTCVQLKNLCEQILKTLESAYEYLLPEDDFILSPEHIYLNVNDFAPNVCFYPGYQKNIRDQIRSLMEYLMNKVDYTDKEAVLLVYQLYAISREESYRFEDLRKLLMENRNQNEFEQQKSKWNNNDSLNSHIYTKDSDDEQIEFKKESIDKKVQVKRQVPAIEEKIEGEKEITFYPLKTYLYLVGCILGGMIVTVLCVVSRILYNSFGNRIDYSKLFAYCLILLCVEGYLIQRILNKKNRITKMVRTQEYVSIDVEGLDEGSEKDKIVLNNQTKKEVKRESALIKKDIFEGKIGLKNKVVKNTVLEYEPVRNVRKLNDEKKARSECEAIDKDRIDKDRIDKKDRIENKEGIRYKEQLAQDKVKGNITVEKMEEDSPEHSYNPTCLLNADLLKPEGCILKSLQESYPNITIEHYPFFIGKFLNNVDYCIENDVISRYHAKVTLEGEDYFLTDLNSTNGTYLNGEMLLTYQKKEVKFGDEITFADLRYQLLKA